MPHGRAALAAASSLFIALGMTMAEADMPPGTDPASPLHQWFETQHSVAGAWCCDVADCYELADKDWRQTGASYEVRIKGRWLPIPPDALRDPLGGANPTGAAIVWYRDSGDGPRIFCFAPGFEY